MSTHSNAEYYFDFWMLTQQCVTRINSNWLCKMILLYVSGSSLLFVEDGSRLKASTCPSFLMMPLWKLGMIDTGLIG